MTNVSRQVEELLVKIHSTGYWRVNIRPTAFEEQRIESLSKCKEIIRNSQVMLRGWYYPHIEPEDMLTSGSDWIENKTDAFNRYVEYWRFYRSSQFIHHFALYEDQADQPFKKGTVLDVLSTLYTFTEIYEFASRLAVKNLLHPAADISIRLIGMEGRHLHMPPTRMFFGERYRAVVDEIPHNKIVSEEELIGSKSELALEAAIHTFEVFNWDQPSRQILAEDQRKFLERRI